MSYTTAAITSGFQGSWTAPTTLLGGFINFDIAGSAGQDAEAGASGGPGGTVQGTYPAAPGDVFTYSLGSQLQLGQHVGGNAGASYGEFGSGGVGGGSTGLTAPNGTLIAEAGGGGGAGASPGSYVGDGGNAAPVAGGGYAGSGSYPGGGGSGASGGTGGAGAAEWAGQTGGSGSAGGNSPNGNGGAGGAGSNNSAAGQVGGGGGGGGGGYGGGGGGGGGYSGSGGGGGGGSSYCVAGASNVVYNASAWTGTVGVVYIGYRTADPPLSPTLGAIGPADASTPITVPWTYNNATDTLGDSSGPQTAWALRIKLTSATAYSYLDVVSGTLSSTIVWNTGAAADGAATSGVIPAGLLANGSEYQYSVACQGTNYDLQGAFANDVLFTPIAEETVTVSVATPVSTATPAVTWSASSQQSFRVVLYTLAQTQASGFIAGSAPNVYDTGVVTSAAMQATIPTSAGLENGATYVAYVTLVDSSGNPSQWGSFQFEVAFDAPVTPTVNVAPSTDPNTGMPINVVTAVTSDNLASATDSSFENGIGSVVAITNCTVAQSTAEALDGAASLLLTASAAGTMEAGYGAQVYPALPGQIFAGVASFRAAATARPAQVGLAFYTSAGALISTAFAVESPSDTTTGWTYSSVADVVAPAGTNFVGLVFQVQECAASEEHYVDCAGLYRPTIPPHQWSLGGFVGNSTLEVQASYDGSTWADLPSSGSPLHVTEQTAQCIDYWCPNGQAISYQVRTVSTAYGQPVYSAWAQVTAAALPNDIWWFVDPTDPVLDSLGYGAVAVNRYYDLMSMSPSGAKVSYTIDQVEDQGVFAPVDSPYNLVVRGEMRVSGPSVLNLAFFDSESFEQFSALRGRQRTLLVKSDEPGEIYYIALGSDRPANTLRNSGRTVDPFRDLTIDCTVVAPPAPISVPDVAVLGGTPSAAQLTSVEGGTP